MQCYDKKSHEIQAVNRLVHASSTHMHIKGEKQCYTSVTQALSIVIASFPQN